MRDTSVVLGIDDPGLQEQVLHFLGRLPAVKVLAAEGDSDALRRIVRARRPDVVVGVPDHLGGLDGVPKLAVSLRETTEALRESIRVGARGFFVWPEERTALGEDIGRLVAPEHTETREGSVVAVLGARGGAGATFLATNLAAAFSRSGITTMLADFDPVQGDVAPALGVPPNRELPSLFDLAAVSHELTDEHLDRVLHDHSEGFRVLLAPSRVPREVRLDAALTAGIVRALRSHTQVTVIHLPRLVDEAVRSTVELADAVLVVATLDVVGIRAARRLVDHLRSFGLAEELRLVVNKATRGEVLPEDVARVLDIPLTCVIGSDRAVERAQNRGELVVGRRGRLTRQITRLANELMEGKAV